MTEYLTEPLATDLDVRHQFRLLVQAFAGIFLSVLILHQFLPMAQPLTELTIHAALIAMTYCLAAVLITVLIFIVRNRIPARTLRVWHVWIISFVTYNLGYFVDLPNSEDIRLLLHEDLNNRSVMFHYLRLLPIWAVFTFILIHVYLAQSLQNELLELREVNRRLSDRVSSTELTDELIKLGDKVTLGVAEVSHVSVDDHYCYVYYKQSGEWKKADVGRPLRSLLCELPDAFVQIHRSHIVNPGYVVEVQRQERNYYLQMSMGTRLPISRSRRMEVLQRLEIT